MADTPNPIFTDAFRAGVKEAVQEAVAIANAKGLPKAYEPEFSDKAVQEAVDIIVAEEKSVADAAGKSTEKKPMRAA